MQIHTLRRMKYGGTFIYVMQFEYVYQYLFSFKDEIFMAHIVAKPAIWRRILWRLGVLKRLYTASEQDSLEQTVLSGAMASLDALNGKKEKVDSAPFTKPIPSEL